METLRRIDQCFIGDEMLEGFVGVAAREIHGREGSISTSLERHVTEAAIALSASADGFTASALAAQARELGNQSPSCADGSRQGAVRSERNFAVKIVVGSSSTRRYEPVPSGLRAITALAVLRDKAIKPPPAAAQELDPDPWRQTHEQSTATTRT